MTASDDGSAAPAPAVLRDERGRLLKGSARPPGAGKKIGSPGRILQWDVKALCEQMGHNPFEAMIELAETARSEKIRYQANAELMKYVAPQLKSVEHRTAEQVDKIVFTFAADPIDVPVTNDDGTPCVEYRPSVEFETPRHGVVDQVMAQMKPKD